MLTANPTPPALDWIQGKTIADFKAFDVYPPCPECEGKPPDPAAPCPACDGTGKTCAPRVHVPETLRSRTAAGAEQVTPVVFRVPDADDLQDGTTAAVEWLGRKAGRKFEDAAAAAAFAGAERWSALDTLGVLSICIRIPKPPYARKFLLSTLIANFPSTTLDEAWSRLGVLRRLWDVQVHDLTEPQYLAFCAEIARVRNTSPLVVCDSGLLSVFIARAASDANLLRMLNLPSGWQRLLTADSSLQAKFKSVIEELSTGLNTN